MVDELVATVKVKSHTWPQWWGDKWSRSWWWTILLTPLVTLWSGALEDFHSDHILWILQTQNNPWQQMYQRVLYWPQYLLAWSWDLGLTARLNALIRVGTFLFCVLWCSRLVAIAAGIRWHRLCTGLVVFCSVWVWWWPELGDSLVYSGTSLGVFVFLAALGDPSGLCQRLSRWWFPAVLVLASFVAASTFVQSLLVVWPLFLWMVWFDASGTATRRLGYLLTVIVGGGAAVLRIVASSNEETGVTMFGLMTKIRTTRHLWDGTLYLWDSLRAATVLVLFSLLMSWWLRSAKLAALGVAGFAVSVSVVPVAALRHVQMNLMMPRYFAGQITIGLLVQFLAVVALVWVSLERRTVWRRQVDLTWLATTSKRVALVVSTVAIVVLSVTRLEFGMDYRDQSGNRKMAVPLTTSTREHLRELQKTSGKPIVVFVDFWDMYPSVFLLQQEGVRAFALEAVPIFDVHQAGFKELLLSRNYAVICAQRFSTCVPEVGFVLAQRGVTRFDVSVFETLKEGSDRVFEILKVSGVETPVVP